MAALEKIRILLADEDALRRDGLAAVLSGSDKLEVVAGAADGEAAWSEIVGRRPDIAVVDLNLPRIHGIELIRRVRAESLGTKIIIVAGTADDEIIREVVRAGGDGYLLKNGPARHLLDAISYVQDGGQYFSPQLGRDGRERHLLEEPARTRLQTEPVEEEDDARPSRSERSRRPRRQPRTVQEAMHLRSRFREEIPAQELDDRDYEIMSQMADGIRPILDRLDEIDSRVAQMETGAEPVPTNPRGWLNTQLADSLRDPRTGTDVAIISRNVNELEARLPQLIEDAVTKRFHQMADKLQQEIEETHVRTMETFVRNIQVKLVQRVSALEHDMSKQAEAMGQLREYSQRTEDNLSRLISGVDKLAQDLPRRLAQVAEQQAAQQTGPQPDGGTPTADAATPDSRGGAETRAQMIRKKRRNHQGDRGVKIFWTVAGSVALLALLAWAVTSFRSRSVNATNATTTAAISSTPEKVKLPAADADTKTKMQAAQECMDRKDYAVAEDLYKQIVKSEPANVDALKGLASVLYREDKIDESAAILDKLSKN